MVIIRLIIFLLFKFYLGAEAGASLPWSAKWQNRKVFGFTLQQLPEAVEAIILTHIALIGYSALGLDLNEIYSLGFSHYHAGLSLGAWLFIPVFAVIYAGIQSATWMFLRWDDGDKDPNTERTSATKPVVDWIAQKLGWKLGDEGYSWIAATVKGTIITLPMGGLGGILFALGYEGGSHFKRWFGYKYHWVSEGLSFVGIGLYAAFYAYLTSGLA